MNRLFKWHFHFNATHNMSVTDADQKHPHTFRVMVCILVEDLDMQKENMLEKALQNYFNRYSGVYLNEVEAFQGKLPTIENLCELFWVEVGQIVKEQGMRLLHIETGDSPLVAYSVGERLLLGFDSSTIRDIEQFEREKEERERSREAIDND